MTFDELTIRGFGKFHDKTISFGQELNILYGGNETGKSTLHSFLRAMLFGMERARGRASKTDFFAHYEPWFGEGAYGGSLKLSENGHVYRIERNFAKSPTDLTVVDETEGTELKDPQGFLKELLGAVSETAYLNTVSISQLKSATDSGMVNELKNYIANMNTTGNRALNITKASEYLKDQRKDFEKRIVADAARNYAADLSEIRKLEEQIASPDFVNHISELNETRGTIHTEQDAVRKEREELLKESVSSVQTLREKHFENRDAILLYEQKAIKAGAACDAAQKRLGNRSRMAGMIFFLLAAAASAAGAFWTAQHVPMVFTPLAIPANLILIGVTVVFLLIALFFSGAEKNARREFAFAGSDFCDIIREHFPELLPASGEPLDTSEVLKSLDRETTRLLMFCDTSERTGLKLKELDEKLAALEVKQSETDQTIVRQQKSQWILEQSLEHLSNLKDEAAVLKKVVAENDRLRGEIDAIDIAQETMTRLAATIRDSFGLYLNSSASALIKGITGGIYDSISIDQDLNVFLNTEKKLIPLEQVSAGTMDQVYLALRLASAEFLEQNGASLPLLFDDSFVNYDEDRLKTALRWLPEAFPGRQILIFTCHRREAQLLSASMIDYRLTEL